MAEMRNFHVLGADDGLPRGEDETSSRGIEFSVMLYYMGWGEFPNEHKNGYWATASDGTPAARPKGMMPKDYPIHSTSTGRLLRDERRQTELDKREEEYEILTAEARKAPDLPG
ncbi:uncharacterized protein J4E92_010471 [Alternaria infectoria]|uniref:uncharacterized protein n=1 Tax=Alternaria infectoria TaxID=45303 RepID=UPI00221E5C7C|nr:uncharacterized protein J4E92_010471 [Alternaria infectoria]KAI4910542.1 hypothetical protein J4E92_010471 [Alternaria infectoria]